MNWVHAREPARFSIVAHLGQLQVVYANPYDSIGMQSIYCVFAPTETASRTCHPVKRHLISTLHKNESCMRPTLVVLFLQLNTRISFAPQLQLDAPL